MSYISHFISYFYSFAWCDEVMFAVLRLSSETHCTRPNWHNRAAQLNESLFEVFHSKVGAMQSDNS